MPDEPKRILVTVKRRAPESTWREAWEAPHKIVTRALRHLKYDRLVSDDEAYDTPDCRLLAIERWDSLLFIVFDLFNTAYDPLTAHMPGTNELPVTMVRISSKDRPRSYPPQPIGRVGESVRLAHNMHGWEARPPYWEDHADGVHPTYYNARVFLWPGRDAADENKAGPSGGGPGRMQE